MSAGYTTQRVAELVLPVFPANLKATPSALHVDLLGEGPVWDHRLNTLFWVDIVGGALNAFVPAHCHFSRFQLLVQDGSNSSGNAVDIHNPGFAVPTATLGTLLFGSQHGLFLFDTFRPRAAPVPLAHPERQNTQRTMRFNDGKVAPTGELYAGSMQVKTHPKMAREAGSGTLYRIGATTEANRLNVTDAFQESAKDVKPPYKNGKSIGGGVTISNGLGWYGDNMYFIDTQTGAIGQYRYKSSSKGSAIGAQQKLMPLNKLLKDLSARTGGKLATGRPDGMCVDSEGMIWVAAIEAGKVVRIDPGPAEPRIVEEVLVPNVPLVTSCCFGGDDMRTLYITTAKGTSPEAVEQQLSKEHSGKASSLAGALFQVRVSVPGLPMTPFGQKSGAIFGGSKL